MAGLFDTFTVATRGINVQQGAINTTAHNIANANTVGYSRQRAVIETTRPFGGMSKFDSCGPGQIGTGAQITSIMRVRDSFIDYQVRNETSKLGNYQVTSDFLSQIEDVFGEPSDSGIQTLFSEFYSSFQELAKTPDKTSARTVALQKASALADASTIEAASGTVTVDTAFIWGDVDDSKTVTAEDSNTVLRYAAGDSTVVLTETQLRAANVDGAGGVTAEDGNYILLKAADKTYVFPVEK